MEQLMNMNSEEALEAPMATLLHIIFSSLLILMASPVFGQTKQTHQLMCQGVFRGQGADLRGRHVYEPYNALGDGIVKFSGILQTPVGRGRLVYEDYTQTAPFDGRLYVETGPYRGNTYAVAVLDNTGGQFLIYDGTPTLGPPPVWGRFDCRWTPLK